MLIKPEPFKSFKDIHDSKHVLKKAVFTQTNTSLLATKKILDHVALVGKQMFGNALSVKMKHAYQTILDDVKITDPTSSDLLKESLKVCTFNLSIKNCPILLINSSL